MKKPRSVTPMGRLVTRALLQNVANQITTVVSNGLRMLEEQQDARFADIELRLRLLEKTAGYDFRYDGATGRRFKDEEGWPKLVEDDAKVPA